MNRRTLLLVVAMAALAGASTWLSRETKQEARQAVTSSEPDYFISEFTATQMGPDGRPARRLRAEQLSHYPTQQVVVERPHLTLYQPGAVPWEMTSRSGTLDDKGQLIQLAGGVHLYRSGPEPADIVTETLRIEPPRRYAATDDPVTLTTPRGRVDAVGMDAYLDERRVVLRSRVKGVYER